MRSNLLTVIIIFLISISQIRAEFLLNKDFIILQQVPLDKKVELKELLPTIRNLNKYEQQGTIIFQTTIKCRNGYNNTFDLIWFLPHEKKLF